MLIPNYEPHGLLILWGDWFPSFSLKAVAIIKAVDPLQFAKDFQRLPGDERTFGRTGLGASKSVLRTPTPHFCVCFAICLCYVCLPQYPGHSRCVIKIRWKSKGGGGVSREQKENAGRVTG